MSAKRNPQTAAKRAREQVLREKRERKAAKKDAAAIARDNPVVPELIDPELGSVGGDDAPE